MCLVFNNVVTNLKVSMTLEKNKKALRHRNEKIGENLNILLR